MTDPSKKLRGHTYLRDGHRCLKCGTTHNLSFQHREASGHGGRGKKAPELTPADGVTLCIVHNQEAEGAGQSEALALGWKIRRNRGGLAATEIPFFDCNTREWYLPGMGATRVPIPGALAQELLYAAGNLTPLRTEAL